MSKGNEPAFPAGYQFTEMGHAGTSGCDAASAEFLEAIKKGLTKREYFAGLAMQGILSDFHNIRESTERSLADASVKSADALLERLEKSNEKNSEK